MPGPAMQPYAHADNAPGEPTRDPITKVLYKIGQVGPKAEDDWNMAHGRNLSGLGGENEVLAPWDPDFRAGYMQTLEKEDDASGSGIFDTYGQSPNVNPDLGLFGTHFSLPGYIDREVQYAVSRDIYDITSGADVVTVAGGGLTYQERGGLPRPFDVLGPTPCPPGRQIPPATGLREPYVGLLKGPAVRRPPSPTEAVFVPLPGPARVPTFPPTPVPVVRGASGPPRIPRVPAFPQGTPVGFESVVNPVRPMVPGLQARPIPGTPFSTVPYTTQSTQAPFQQIVNPAVISTPAGVPYVPQQVPMTGNPTGVPSQFTVDVGVPSQPIAQGGQSVQGLGAYVGRRRPAVKAKSFGATDDAPGWGTYLFAGALVGASAAMFYGAMNMNKKRAR